MGNKAFRHVPLLLILTLFYLSGCGLFSTEPDRETLPIEGKILFSVLQDPSATPTPAVRLSMQTEKTYGCINYLIDHNLFPFGKVIRINLKGIYLPENICLTALGRAGASRQMELGDGTYTLQFAYKNKSDQYLLAISGSDIQIAPIQASFTKEDTTLCLSH